MITCKEDLKFKYVDGNNEELADAFQKILFSFGVKWSIFNDQQVRLPKGGCSSIVFNGKTINLVSNEFANEYYNSIESMSDLKQRTNVEYEKLDESNFNVWDLKPLLESGELYSKTSNGDYVLYSANAPTYMLMHFNEYGVYRKVERPLEWWEDAVEHLSSNCKGVTAAGYCKDTNSIAITGHMNQEQCYDFARILLEQEGE